MDAERPHKRAAEDRWHESQDRRHEKFFWHSLLGEQFSDHILNFVDCRLHAIAKQKIDLCRINPAVQ